MGVLLNYFYLIQLTGSDKLSDTMTTLVQVKQKQSTR